MYQGYTITDKHKTSTKNLAPIKRFYRPTHNFSYDTRKIFIAQGFQRLVCITYMIRIEDTKIFYKRVNELYLRWINKFIYSKRVY